MASARITIDWNSRMAAFRTSLRRMAIALETMESAGVGPSWSAERITGVLLASHSLACTLAPSSRQTQG